jgi:uncharacterized repeat protein (TIGR04138 family)
MERIVRGRFRKGVTQNRLPAGCQRRSAEARICAVAQRPGLHHSPRRPETMEELDFAALVDLVRKDDPRFDRRAYFFLRDALDHTVKAVRKAEAKSAKPRGSNHVTGQELLEGIREHAVQQFGPMAHLVLTQWGLACCRDFGDMVYQLIEFGVFSKTETDRKEDFADIYTFEDAFVKPFQPKKRRLPPMRPAEAEV